MQIQIDKHDETTELRDTLALPQPHAARIALGLRTIVLFNEPAEPSENVLICATSFTDKPNLPANTLLAVADLIDVKPVKKLTEAQLDELGLLDKIERIPHENKYAYIFANPRRMVELPFDGKRGYYKTAWLKDSLVEYPTEIVIA